MKLLDRSPAAHAAVLEAGGGGALGGATRTFTAPTSEDWVLYVRK